MEVITSGILTLSTPVDYEITKRFSFTVSASDSGTPPLKSFCTVKIDVIDVNDNAPKFGKSIYEAVVRENSAPGTKVIKVVIVFAHVL